MAIKIGANLAYNGKLPNFERDSFETKAAMKAFDENSIDEGHLSYCKEDGNNYQYKHTNTVDTTTGRWRIFKTDIVVDAALNGTSKNPIQNKAVFDALKLKANTVALGAYQPKYNAGFVAQTDINESALPKDTKGVNLNGFTLTITKDTTLTKAFIINGTIAIADSKVLTLNVDNCSNVIIKNAETKEGVVVVEGNFYNCIFNSDTHLGNVNIYSSIIYNHKIIRDVFLYYCVFNETINITNDEQCSLFCWFVNAPAINIQLTQDNFSGFFGNCFIDDTFYLYGNVVNNELIEVGFDAVLNSNSTCAPQTNIVYEALQLKADKTQLNDLATKTELNSKADASALNNYVTTATANTTYAKKSDITNVYKFKGTKNTYNDLPETGQVTGDVWNITTADANYGIKAGDNVAWNGTAWDNLSGTVDLSGYVTTPALDTKLVPYATIASVNDKLTKKTDVTTTDAISADVKKLMDKAFPFTVKVSIDKTLAKKGTSQPVKVTITPKIGDDNTEVDAIMINGEEHHGTIPYVYSTTTTTTTTYNVRADKTGRNSAQGSATITFVNPSYDGAVAANFTVTEANIKALTETLRSGKGGTRTFNLNNQKACIAYPKAFDAATGIKDANGFDYLASYTRSELNVNGELYYVYLLTNATTITDMKQTVS